MKVGFTGSRKGMSQHQKEQFALEILRINPTEFHHGDCIGADAEAHDIVREFLPDTKIVVHPPLSNVARAFRVGDETRAPFAYTPRDRNIVIQTDFLIGSPLQDVEIIRSGTWLTIRYSRKLGKPNKVLKR